MTQDTSERLGAASHLGVVAAIERSRAGRVFLAFWSVACFALTGYYGWRASGALREFVDLGRPSYTGPLGPPGIIGREVGPVLVRGVDEAPRLLDLRGQSALVLFYDKTCYYCRFVMSSWLDLIADARRSRTPVVGIAIGSPGIQSTYWTGLEHVIELVAPVRDSAVVDWLAMDRTPTTVLITNGRIRAQFVGALSDWQKRIIANAMLGD